MLDLVEFNNDPVLARDTLLARLKAAATATERAGLHYRLWEMCQACGEETEALRHLDIAVQLDPVQLPSTPESSSRMRLVVLNVLGTFQANAPIAMLLDEAVAIYTVWISGKRHQRESLVQAVKNLNPDAVILAMGEDERQLPAILEADAIARSSGAPVLNNAAQIIGLTRSGVPDLLKGIAKVIVPACKEVCVPFENLPAFPLLVRPVSSHAGHDLAKVDDREAFNHYIQTHDSQLDYYVTQFVNYMGVDGLYRKYRVVFIDGVPYPVHLAIHEDWAIWYYNAKMENFPERRAEEARFLADMKSYFPLSVMNGLSAIAERVGLEYFGLDFGVLQDGSLLLFEVETAMIVHDRDPEDVFPYKKVCIARIRHAFEAMIEARGQRMWKATSAILHSD
ncbi:hypothetical protein [Acetobacter sp.]|uniref:hypothetical protein n=1 Tax=Acetobacter sp. TaxID=440 RepID=UPI0039EAE6CF